VWIVSTAWGPRPDLVGDLGHDQIDRGRDQGAEVALARCAVAAPPAPPRLARSRETPLARNGRPRALRVTPGAGAGPAAGAEPGRRPSRPPAVSESAAGLIAPPNVSRALRNPDTSAKVARRILAAVGATLIVQIDTTTTTKKGAAR
jgi:hypothetical protein